MKSKLLYTQRKLKNGFWRRLQPLNLRPACITQLIQVGFLRRRRSLAQIQATPALTHSLDGFSGPLLAKFPIFKFLWVYFFSVLWVPLMAVNEYSLVFIHLGEHLPECSYITLKQARFMNASTDIYFLVDHNKYIELSEDKSDFVKENKILLVDLSLLPKTAKHCLFQQISPFDKSYKSGFWNHTTERFFYLHDFLEKTRLKNVVHLETDVMLYADIGELLPSFSSAGAELAGTFQWTTECVPGFVFIQHLPIWERYIDHVIAELQSYQGNDPITHLNDMRTLASFKKECEPGFINLPIVMPEYRLYYAQQTVSGFHENTTLEFLSNNASFFSGYLFDAAAFGIYANGYDQTVYPQGKPGDIHWKSLFDPSKIAFSWGKDKQGRDVPYATLGGNGYRLVNLHFHSKHPEGFTSFKETRELFR